MSSPAFAFFEVMATPNPLSLCIVAMFGTIFGSFLNVCIYRLPAGRSIVLPGSACGSCGVTLQWWQNIPILSYLALAGSCATCSSPFSPRYLFIEALTGLMAASFYKHFGGPSYEFLFYFVMGCLLIVIFFVDLDYWIILDSTSLGGMVAGMVGSLLLPGRAMITTPFFLPLDLSSLPAPMTHLMASLIGAAVGWLFFYAIAVVGGMLARQEAMGGGDVKFAAMIGAFLGWERGMMSFILAFFIGTIVAVPLMLLRGGKRRDPIPFGTFMAIGVFVVILFGQDLTPLDRIYGI